MNTLDRNLEIAWDYLQIPSEKRKVDGLIVMGSNDTTVAERGARLFQEGLSNLIITTGNAGRLTPQHWHEPEAKKFAQIIVGLGVPIENILIEGKSTNTNENILFTKDLVRKKGINLRTAIFIMQPCLERRTYTMFLSKWPKLKVFTPHKKVAYKDYANIVLPKNEIANLIVGEISRLEIYGNKGYSTKQEIPRYVKDVFEYLVLGGFIKYLVQN